MLQKLLKVFFHLLYHQYSWGYDFVAAVVSIGQWKNWGKHTLAFIEGQQILELGFGPGHLHRNLLERGFHIFGLDESLQMNNHATRSLISNNFTPRFCQGMAQSLPYPANTFDCVVATFPSEYIRDPQTLMEAKRVLRAPGKMVVLMSAWIGSKGIRHKAAQTLFRVTRQGTPIEKSFITRALQPFTDAGFETETQVVEHNGTDLLYILARKPGSL